MTSPSDDLLYEVQVTASDNGPWRQAGTFDTLESARVAAVHLVTDTDAHRVRIMHIVEYYAKAEAPA
jgi:hypothetical protein